MLRRHKSGEHFDLKCRDIGKEADAIGHAALVRFENIEHVAYEVTAACFCCDGVSLSRDSFAEMSCLVISASLVSPKGKYRRNARSYSLYVRGRFFVFTSAR